VALGGSQEGAAASRWLPVPGLGAAELSGIVVVCGTGSVVWGRNGAGRTHTCGGWGPWVGDAGGGASLVRQAIQAACLAADGSGPDTSLLPLVLENWQAPDMRHLITKNCLQTMPPDQLARLAGQVLAQAEQDPVARDLVQQSARQLLNQIRAVAKQLELDPSETCLAYGGGLLCHSSTLRGALWEQFHQYQIVFRGLVQVDRPAEGALLLAAQSLG